MMLIVFLSGCIIISSCRTEFLLEQLVPFKEKLHLDKIKSLCPTKLEA